VVDTGTAQVEASAHGAAVAGAGSDGRVRLAVGIALFAGTLALFAQSIGFEFLSFDDRKYVTENPWVARGLALESIRWAFTTFYFTNWHPLTWLSYMLDFELYGLDAAGFHASNVVLHALNVALVFRVLARATGRTWPSALVAALFAAHPLHVEAVAWIAQRKELLSAFFGLLAIDAYTSWTRRGGAWRYARVVVWAALALMAKPMWVSLPLLLLLLDAWPLRRLALRRSGGGPAPELAGIRTRLVEKLPLVGLSLLSCTLTLFAQERAMDVSSDVGLALRAANAVVAYAAYLAKTLWPAGLSVLYPHPYLPGGTPLAPQQIVGASLLLLAITAVALRARTRPYLLVGWLWFLVSLLPTIGLVQVGWQAMADRYTYVPHLGLFAMFAWSADDAVRYLRGRSRGAAALALAAVLLAVFGCAARSAQQMGAWRDTVTLYRHSLAATPDSHWLHFNLGNRLLVRGEHAAAREHFAAALRLRPGWDLAAGNLAWLLATTPEPALRDPQRAIELAEEIAQSQSFRDPNTLDTLAAAYAAAGDFERALALGRRASALAQAQGRDGLASEIDARVRGYASGMAYVAPVQR
jgi:hypothetical protein